MMIFSYIVVWLWGLMLSQLEARQEFEFKTILCFLLVTRICQHLHVHPNRNGEIACAGSEKAIYYL